MSHLNQTENVKHQYSGDRNLAARINLHAKHSTNKQGHFPWLSELYQFAKNDTILELGCGNGEQWKGRTQNLPVGSRLILSDFSEGMLSAAKENLAPSANLNFKKARNSVLNLHRVCAPKCKFKFAPEAHISFQLIDIQNIPFESQSFNTIIANHMLYHIPDLDKALSEVRRVLKTGGKFYTATSSRSGLMQYMHNTMKKFDPDTSAFSHDIPFNMENGGEILAKYFSCVKRHDYIDSLAITNTQDLVGWMESTISASGYNKENSGMLYNYFENIRVTEGTINIPKKSCLFVCTAE